MTINGPAGISPLVHTPPPRAAERPPAPRPAPPTPPAAMPNGADPALWNVLTSEERAFFSEIASLGPISYGRRSASPPEPQAPVGQRLDVTA